MKNLFTTELLSKSIKRGSKVINVESVFKYTSNVFLALLLSVVIFAFGLMFYNLFVYGIG